MIDLTEPVMVGPWLVVTALLVALGAMFFQYLQARMYWLHSLTVEKHDADTSIMKDQ